MKLVLPIFFAAKILAEECSEGCESDFCHIINDDEDCGDFRTLQKTKRMIDVLMCPEDEDSSNPACAGRYQDNGKFKSIQGDIKRATRHYGCNCFQKNHRTISPAGSNVYYPKSNGQAIDDFDAACYDLNQKYRCFILDKLNGDLEDTCDYHTSYNWHVDDDGIIQCGRKKDLNYMVSGDNCRRALCQMELSFAKRTAEILSDPYQFKLDNANKYGLWADNQCYKAESSMTKDMCCGEDNSDIGFYTIHKRVPYDPVQQCCQDGQVVSLLECI